MSRPRSDDQGEFVSVGGGAVSSAGGDSGLAAELLDATALLTRVSVLLSEASADDWKELRPRIAALRAAIRLIPRGAPRRRRLGY